MAPAKRNEGASSAQPIVIPDDNEPPQSSLGREVQKIVQQLRQQQQQQRTNPIELLGGRGGARGGGDADNSSSSSSSSCADEQADGWAQLEADYDREIQHIESIDLTQSDNEDDSDENNNSKTTPRKRADARCPHYDRHARNPCLCGAYDRVDEHVLASGDCLQVAHVYGLADEVRVGRFLVDFVEVTALWVRRGRPPGVDGAATVLVRGLAYTRTRNLDGRVPAYQNEVCQVLQLDTNDPRPGREQAAVQVALEQLHVRGGGSRVLLKTNKPFPACRFEPADYRDRADREDRAPLVCRWQHAMHYPDRRYRRAQRPVDGEVLRHFVGADVPKRRHRASDAERLDAWRRCPKIRGGSYVPDPADVARATAGVVRGDGHYVRVPGQQYTAADLFSGAGGVTKGAKLAGLRVVLAVDHWQRCNATYRANHPEVELHEVDIMDFCNDLTDEDDYDGGDNNKPSLDLMHLSPPCQTWSPAHTVTGRNDPANIAALSACQHIVHKHRPRVVTFEQTFGIVHERHLPYFNALVQSLTRYGYSLKWRVFPLVQFGLPQNRKRLLMIGAAPGEPLPAWPAPTHGDAEADPGSARPYVSAIKACQMLRAGVDLHNVEGAKALRPHREPWDGHKPMNRTITTSGGQSYHWEGQRELTLAEFARLQGFPYDYQFVGPCIKKQIGNAFPPCVVRVFMSHLRRHLETLDHIADDVDSICLNDDDDDQKSSPNWWPAKAEKKEDSKPGCPLDLEYLNMGLTPDEAWMAAVEESRRDHRRRSTAGSSVVVTGTRQLLIEVMDDEDEDGDTCMPDGPAPVREPEHNNRFFSSLLCGPCSPARKKHVVDASALTPRTSSIAGPSLSTQTSLPYRPHPQLRRQDSAFFDTQGYAEVFPKAASPSVLSSSPVRAGSSSSGTISNSYSAARFAPDGQQLDPTNFGQIEEAFRRNRGARPCHISSSILSPSPSEYQEQMSEAAALDAALQASVQQQHGGMAQVPSPVPEQAEEEGEPISEEAAAVALKFFGPWNPPGPSHLDGEGEEAQPYVGKGKGRAIPAQAVDEDGDTRMDEDAQLQMAIAMSMEGVPQAQDEEKDEKKPEAKRAYISEGDEEEGSPSKRGRTCM